MEVEEALEVGVEEASEVEEVLEAEEEEETGVEEEDFEEVEVVVSNVKMIIFIFNSGIVGNGNVS